jgi:transcriptional regulator with XRE-family HTH domain
MPDPAPDSPASRLRAARESARLSQAAAAAGMPGRVTIQYWSDVENGRRTPSLEWLWNAAKAIGCDPHALDERLQANARPKPKRSR